MEPPRAVKYDVGMSRRLLAYAFSGILRQRTESDTNGLELLAIAPDEKVIIAVNSVLDMIFSPSKIGPRTRTIFELTSGLADGVRYEYSDLSRYYENQGNTVSPERIRQIHNTNLRKLNKLPIKRRLESLLH